MSGATGGRRAAAAFENVNRPADTVDGASGCFAAQRTGAQMILQIRSDRGRIHDHWQAEAFEVAAGPIRKHQ
jgi:hypothetical protein